MKHKSIVLLLGVFLLILGTAAGDTLQAQCAMCKAAAEANLKTGGTDPVGLNMGILYMLLAPYLLVGSIGYWWWRNRKTEAEMGPKYTEEELSHMN